MNKLKVELKKKLFLPVCSCCSDYFGNYAGRLEVVVGFFQIEKIHLRTRFALVVAVAVVISMERIFAMIAVDYLVPRFYSGLLVFC